MKIKIKRVALSKVNFLYHPTFNQITSHDHFTLDRVADIHTLSLCISQTLLNLSPLLVCQSCKEENMDWQLNPNPTVALLKSHPEAHKLTATIYYYPEEMLSEVLKGTLLFAPALSYREHNKLLANLSRRIQQSKSLLKHPPAKKQLAQWAKVQPSAIRHNEACNG